MLYSVLYTSPVHKITVRGSAQQWSCTAVGCQRFNWPSLAGGGGRTEVERGGAAWQQGEGEGLFGNAVRYHVLQNRTPFIYL